MRDWSKRFSAEEIHSLIEWWEGKRILFNWFVLFGVLLGFLFKGDLPLGVGKIQGWIHLLFLVFGANLFYCLGLGVELCLNYYFSSGFLNAFLRGTLFLIGSGFSTLCMFFALLL